MIPDGVRILPDASGAAPDAVREAPDASGDPPDRPGAARDAFGTLRIDPESLRMESESFRTHPEPRRCGQRGSGCIRSLAGSRQSIGRIVPTSAKGETSMRKALIALALAATLLASPALFDPLWSLLTADAGCIGDPLGGCAPTTTPQTDEGCILDPYGCPKGS
jgi:hypothetical protein